MLKQRTVPGVYIQEINAFPNSIVQVPTALPVFIGYTEKGNLFKNKVMEIGKLADYEALFGAAPSMKYTMTKIVPAAGAAPSTIPTPDVVLNANSDTPLNYTLAPVPGTQFLLYNSLQLFFQNGGGTCYVMSIGTYAAEGSAGPVSTDFDYVNTIKTVLQAIEEPTMILVPDALLFSTAGEYYALINNLLSHCNEVQSRMTFIDAYGGDAVRDPLKFNVLKSTTDTNGTNLDPISQLRFNVSSAYLNYGAAYYPWLDTSIVAPSEITFANISGGFISDYFDTDTTNLPTGLLAKIVSQIPDSTKPVTDLSKSITKSMHNALLLKSPNYQSIMSGISKKLNCLPTAPAVAGCISQIDANMGVWKAPANYGLNAVNAPVLSIDDFLQDNMNVDALSGKSVNAIRSFKGQGVLIWGARTLEGNSQDWRYISVRRTLIMIEQSVKLAARTYVFEANDAGTWLNLKSEIENFLTGIWKQGGLAGSKATEAFNVTVGLGSTMTGQDILDGYLDVAIQLAVTHPAEFIEISFKQQIQTS